MAAPTIFQTGGPNLTGAPTKGFIAVDNGGPQATRMPIAAGTFIMNGATPVVVADTNVSAGSAFNFGLKTVGGTVGAYPSVKTVTPGTGFTVAGTAGDTSTYNYQIFG
jgi:hypothetical protein